MRKVALALVGVVATAAGLLVTLSSLSSAQLAPQGVTSPLLAVSVAQQTIDGPYVEVDVEPLVGLTLEETRERYHDTGIELRVAVQQKAADDRQLAGARFAVQELRQETEAIAHSTVEGAITNYRRDDLEQSLFEIEDLNTGLRANALADAAIVADTTTFDRYREAAKDLQLAEYNLAADLVENERLRTEIELLHVRMEAEQSWLSDYEERDLQRRADAEWAAESVWNQQLGTKQGLYLRTCPVRGTHEFIDSWGFPRSGGRRHKGVDVLAAIGTPIVSPVDGVVSFRSNSVGGRSFHLTDEKGNYFYGTHLSAYGDVEGEVRAGEVIGYVGDDGNAAGIPHLHFEIHPGGRGNAINPYPDSAAVCDGAL